MISKTNIDQKFKTTLACIISVFLVACGGGSSNSGPTAPPPPSFTLYSSGQYSGTIDFSFVGEGIVDTSEEPTVFSPQVQGTTAGRQQIRIGFRQFSGTSSIGPNGEFSIASGPFGLAVRDMSGGVVTRCNGEFLFEGTFSDSTSLSGNVTTTSPFICEETRLGPVTATGPFEATFGAAKQGALGSEISAYAADF